VSEDTLLQALDGFQSTRSQISAEFFGSTAAAKNRSFSARFIFDISFTSSYI